MNSSSLHGPMASGRAESTDRSTGRRSTLIVTAAVAGLFAGLAAGSGAEGRVQQAAEVTATVENDPAPAREPYARLDPAAFEERMRNEQAMVINVHVPYEGELAGTDAFIPYNKIRDDPRLPEDKGTELLLYCRSGRMSEEAAVDLHEEGSTNIAHLEGGMKAWEASGRPVDYNAENAAKQSAPPKL